MCRTWCCPALPAAGAVHGAHQPAHAAAHQGPQVWRRHPLWGDGARLAVGAWSGLPAARPVSPRVARRGGGARAGGGRRRDMPARHCMYARGGACKAATPGCLHPSTNLLLAAPTHPLTHPPTRSLHSCSDYTVMDVCANCGLLISTVNVPQAAAGAGWADHIAGTRGALTDAARRPFCHVLPATPRVCCSPCSARRCDGGARHERGEGRPRHHRLPAMRER